MTVNPLLAQYANIAAYSAIVVLAAAMVGFVLDLAHTAARQLTPDAAARVPVPVPASGVAPAPGPVPGPSEVHGPGIPSATVLRESNKGARQAAGIATALTWLGAALVVAAAILRGAAVSRVPWGNMFEFSLTGSAAVTVTYLAMSVRRDVRWLGTFVVGPVVLMLGLAVTVFYTEASPLLPSLRSFWLVIHVSIAILAVALFTLASAVTVLQMIQDRRENAASQRSLVHARTAQRRSAGPAGTRAARGGFPAVDIHPDRRRHLGAEGVGRVLAVGSQRGVDVRDLGRLRGIPARACHVWLVNALVQHHRPSRIRVHHHQLHHRQHVLRRHALLLRNVIPPRRLRSVARPSR